MNKLLSAFFLLCVTCVTSVAAHADTIVPDAKAGAKKNAMCMGCHGIDGYHTNFPVVYQVPRIAGQTAAYITAALNEYKKGDRKHPSMRGIAQSLSDQDIADLAAYFSTDAGQTQTPPAATPPAAIQALISRDPENQCTKCHGANFSTPNDGSVPKLAGQHADYLLEALRSYKLPESASSVLGRANPIMGGNAKKFSDAELEQLADYIGSLPGELKTVPESRFR